MMNSQEYLQVNFSIHDQSLNYWLGKNPLLIEYYISFEFISLSQFVKRDAHEDLHRICNQIMVKELGN